MAHELAQRKEGSYAMAFVGETPWHRLGQQLTEQASIGVWKKEAGLDWEAVEAAPFVGVPGIDSPSGKHQYVDFPDYKALYRSDTLAPLAIVGSNYKVVQPGECLEFFRDLVEAGGWHIHTAGVLRGGRKVWAMATRGESAVVFPTKGSGADRIHNNLLLATSLDGSMRTTVMETSVRVVCANTLAIATDYAGAGKTVRVSHRQDFNHEQVKAQLGLRHDRFKQFMERAREMADTPIKLDEATEILRKAFRVDDKPKVETSWMGSLSDLALPQAPDEIDLPRGLLRVLDLFQGEGKGADLKTAKGTRWGLLNAVTEYVDHEMGRTDDTRLDSAWFGRGNELKNLTHNLLTAE